MPHRSAFNSPFLLGFEQLEQLLDTVAKNGGDAYPPYNIEQTDPNNIRISLAVAGFSQSDLTLMVEASQLIIRGKQNEAGESDNTYLHRGIAARQFQRKFVLADGMIVKDAFLEHGLLHIDLNKPEPDQARQIIEIR